MSRRGNLCIRRPFSFALGVFGLLSGPLGWDSACVFRCDVSVVMLLGLTMTYVVEEERFPRFETEYQVTPVHGRVGHH